MAISIDVRTDVLTDFDASLTDGETRDEVIAARLGLEDLCRLSGWESIDGTVSIDQFAQTRIELTLDAEDHETLNRVMRADESRGSFFTALMLGSVRRQCEHTVCADEPLFATA